ncbi:MAG: prepilin-type N-terminal cleavage/methylation domain-containing protein [Deltaproteobacteria bacterium]|jgi:type IV pilus assembly protein PilE|nr:prepilin-type N-terminal cleavage/methylation domain-containing protein [Deltaproteobacteria bacterium]MBT4087639.1 prepilin-type N-terminal cleavage/methylation domain-containing protein [Deltaproteobacteria bacterium]MBT4263928.1 prepilin-type N-terminal cleavage/methylation domain-containing protein [Deltaproteobacteria bacterium]MBT4639871.1 prepilin-type N-terminal cleavage/methylation domain-containing protein [Deltaproteobacteria bacterium]MBT6503444.1 prepilin-type N-terminal cleavag
MKMRQAGLSLIEIMITLVIVAVIAGLAYPRYQKMVSRSKQTEAKTILQAVYVGQDLYKMANQVYCENLEMLDIQIPQNAKYTYSSKTGDNGTSFVAKAVANIDSDPVLDEWQINHLNQLVNSVNDVVE